MDIDSDVHDRQKRISGWGQEKITDANVAVVGAGALGNEVVKNLLQLGVQRLTIIDFDTVVKANLNRCVLFTEADAENKTLKAEAMTLAGQKLNPSAAITPIIKNVETLDDKFFANFDAVFGCLDNLGARLHVNANCYNAVPLIDGGTTGFMGKVQVVSKPSACIECAMSKQDYAILWRKYSCTGKQLDIFDPKMPALPTTTSIIAGIQANEFLKIIHSGKFGASLAGRYLFYNGLTAETRIYSVEKREKCPVHQ
ncbi:MAG: ThiF family adenylyltransferase [Candidatus Micrarchaeota archaeon]|nr:ThiF family adenylyltransferase [Candidatus Micrarchaeota archaeon]